MNCTYCGDKREREYVDMDYYDAMFILDGIETSCKKNNEPLPELRLFLSGEPTLYGDLDRIIIAAANMQFPSILIHTNGIQRGSLANAIENYPVTSSTQLKIVFSMDGKDKKQWTSLKRVPAMFYDNAFFNIQILNRCIKDRSKIKLAIQCCLPEKDIGEAAKVREKLEERSGYVAEVTVRSMHNWDEEDSIKGAMKRNYGTRCDFMFHDLVIYSNGLVGLCCADLNARTTFGHIKENFYFDIYEAFRCRNRRLMQLDMLDGKRFYPCSNCERYGIK